MRTTEEPELGQGALDGLVLDYIKQEELGEGGSPSSISAAKRSCEAARQLVEGGRIPEALELIQKTCPAALQDQRLLFNLQKQWFVELLRQGTPEGDRAALDCARDVLAPLALDAHPEAYPEFKSLLLLLVDRRQSGDAPQQPCDAAAAPAAAPAVAGGGGGPRSQPQAGPGPGSSGAGGERAGPGSARAPGAPCLERCEWGLDARKELADQTFHTMRRQLDWLDPLLALLLRYLLHLAAAYEGSLPAGSAPLPEAVARAALMPCDALDAPALPCEAMAGRTFPEADVQAIVHAAGVPRAAAVEALKSARGDAADALKDQLMRLRLERDQLDTLVWEYATYRCLLQSGDDGASKGSPPSGAMDVGVQRSEQHQQPPAAGSRGASGSGSGGSSPGSKRPSAERQPPLEQLSPQGLGTPGSGAASSGGGSLHCRSDSQSPPYKKHKPLVWRGRQAGLPDLGAAGRQEGGGQQQAGGSAKLPAPPPGAGKQPPGAVGLKPPAVLAQVQALCKEGRYEQVVERVEELCPGAWQGQPALLFELRCAQHASLLGAGDVAAALRLAREHMAPLADAHPALVPRLKGAMAALLPSGLSGGGAAGPAVDTAALVSSIQSLLQRKLGIPEPRLASLLRALLAAHKSWCRWQRCSDPFAGIMQIDRLRAGSAASERPASAAAAGAAGAGGAQGVPALLAAAVALGSGGAGYYGDMSGGESSEAGRDEEDEEGGDGLSEEGLLQLMEIFELSRGAAAELLTHHGGNVEAAINELLPM